MNDIEQQPEAEPQKKPLARRQAEAVPICTLYSDGAIRVEDRAGVSLMELQRLLLASVLSIADRTAQRATGMERLLGAIQTRFELGDPELEEAIAAALGQRQQPPQA
jgi:hypothetical protein